GGGGGGGGAEPPLLRGGRDLAMCRGDRLGSSDPRSSSYRRGYGPDPGLRGRIGVCPAIRPDLRRPSDCNDIDCREGRAAEGGGCIGGDRLYRDGELGREGV